MVNQDTLITIILPILFLIVVYILDEGGLLILFGIFVGIIALKFDSIFTIADTEIILIFRMVIVLIAIFSIAKSMYIRKEIQRGE